MKNAYILILFTFGIVSLQSASVQNFTDKMANISKQMNDRLPHRQDKIITLATTTYIDKTFTYYYIIDGADSKTNQELQALVKNKTWIKNMKKIITESLVNQYCTKVVLKNDLEKGLKVQWIHSLLNGKYLFDASVTKKDCK